MDDDEPPVGSSAPTEPSQHADNHLVAPATTTDATEITPSIENGAPAEIPQSQPMTATTSSASQNPAIADGDGSADAPTYGTRSRNKGGNARPNYADDRELDLEIEAAGRIPKSKPKKATAHTSTPALSGAQEDPRVVPAQNGFASVNASAATTNGVPAPRDPLPGMSTFSTQATAPGPSKKRKQPGGSSTTASTPAPTQAMSKTRVGASSSTSRLHLETNMMTFDRCRSRLNAKKQLIADDGTALAANGESSA